MVRGFLIAGTHSGCGKTTVTLGILRVFKKRGIKLQPFKVGPDYIDTSWHKVVCGRPSVNLDLFAMEKDLEYWFLKYALRAELSVVEGVMGLFDGSFSSYQVAKRLGLPVVLVVDTFGMAETVEAIALGFKKLLEKDGIKLYLVLNRVSSERHLTRLLKVLKKFKVVGYLFRNSEISISSRHLGLFMPGNETREEEKLKILEEQIEKNFDLEFLESLKSCKNFENLEPSFSEIELPFSKLAIAYDSAFCFYYTHLLDLLSEKAKLYFFSPLKDKKLPSSAEAVYIGGGYPELWAELLVENKFLKKDLKDWVEEGKPVYAECGGLVYLSKILFYKGKKYPMVGIFPLEVEMKGLHLGYREVFLKKESFFLKTSVFRGHEFHYTLAKELSEIKKAYLVKDLEGNSWEEGYTYKNALGSYVHFINFIS